ncbi:MAG: hypothetical protein NDI61_08080, partial [Bdellovibrionaceae bacterium]|nr:hypothetical protein [Pseudobdellovibrionaceae bacterium]
QYVREGIINFIEKFSDESTLSGSISGRGFGTRLSTADLVKLAGENIDPALLITPRNLRKSDPGREKYDMAPESSKQVSHIGTKEFALGDDAFFHDRNLPYVARRDNSGWKLYPIDERTYELYSQGGALNQQRSVKRDLSPAARDQAAQNLKLFRAIRSGEVKLEDVRVERYDSIAAARQEDRMHLYPWQIKVALDGIRIKEDPDKDHPLEVLVRNRGDNTADPRIGRTALEKAFFSDAKEIDAGAVMGHYQHMQLTYEKMRASITHPKSALSADHQAALTAEIDASQAKMHRAARKLLEPFLAKVVEASKNPAAKEYLRQHPEFNMMWEYYTRSPLAYPTIEEAWKNGLRDTVTVVRSASTGDVERFGFMSDAQKRRYLFKVPAIGKFVQKVIQQLKIYSRQIVERGELEVDPNAEWQLAEVIARKVAPRVAANKDLRAMVDALLKYILVHPHEHRSFDPETASYFAVDFLHAQEDLGPKERLSTTVNPIYVLRADEKENVYDPKFAMSRPTIYMIQVPINAISVDNASRFVVQDEIRINSINWSRNARRATVWSMAANENDQFPMPAGPAPAEAQAVFDALHATPSGLGKAQAPVAGN